MAAIRIGAPTALPPDRRTMTLCACAVPVLLANALLLADCNVPLLTPAVGLWLSVVLPALLLHGKLSLGRMQSAPRALICLTATLGLLLLLGLALNFGLAAIGVTRPLGRVPVTLGLDLQLALIVAFRRDRLPSPIVVRETLSRDTAGVLVLSAFTVMLAVVGTIRLNNGTGGEVTLVMLGLVVVVFARLLVIRNRLAENTIIISVYLLSLALLLMTSLRGWYVTGHDIQREFRLFELVNTSGSWSPARLHEAYNACLSITVLPTILAQATNVPDPYVFKLLYQALFGFCPVAVYLITRRYATRGISLVACLFFVAFPTYFTDMPFLNRQEISFLFVSSSVLVIAEPSITGRAARRWLSVLSVGIVLTHYSTSFVFGAVLGLAWIGYRLSAMIESRSVRRGLRLFQGVASGTQVVSLLNVLLVIVFAFLWYGPITNTGDGLGRSLTQAGRSLIGVGVGEKSSDVNYGLFSSQAVSPRDRLTRYEDEVSRQTDVDRVAGVYFPASLVGQFPVETVHLPDLPITSVGKLLGFFRISVAAANGAIRQGIARLLQVLVLVGLVVVALEATPSVLVVTREFYCLGLASFAIVGMQVLVPGVSIEYGVLRAFQQALLLLAPFLAIGSTFLLRPLGSAAAAGAAWLALGAFVSTSGLLPQLTGGYPAQLNLNNSGLYYDLYYVHPEEVAGVEWIRGQASVTAVQSEVQADGFASSRLQTFTDVTTVNDIFPSLIRKDAYVFLGFNTVRGGTSTISFQGDLIRYSYPRPMLLEVKPLVYSNGGTEVFR